MRKKNDFTPNPFPKLSWGSDKSQESIEEIYNYAMEEVKRFIEWYYERRKGKRRFGILLRAFAILFTAAAGIIPILGTIFNESGKPLIPPAFATLALAVAALLVLFDRFGGFTSSWIRYINTAQELSQLLENFRFEWANCKFILQTEASNNENETQAICYCRDFMVQVFEVIREETQKWAAEFQSVLKDIDKTTKAVEKANVLGAVSVEVTNGDHCQNGWTISIDGGTERKHKGKQASLHNLTPTIHTIHVCGTINGKEMHAEKPVEVASGRISTLMLTLE